MQYLLACIEFGPASLHRMLKAVRQEQGLLANSQFIAADSADVQKVVHQAGEMSRLPLEDVLQRLNLRGSSGQSAQQFCARHYRRQRVAQLMGQHGKKQSLPLARVDGFGFSGARIQRGQGQVGVGLSQVQDQGLQAFDASDGHLRCRGPAHELVHSAPEHLELVIDGGEKLAWLVQWACDGRLWPG